MAPAKADLATALVPAGATTCRTPWSPGSPRLSEEGGMPGGGIEGLAMMMNMLGADLQNTQEGMGRLVSEADEVLQGVFERIGILHARTSRIETVLGLPPWQPPEEEEDEEDGAQASPMSARTDHGEEAWGCGMPEEGSPKSRRRRKPKKARKCRRGHPLEEDDECSEDSPPQLCSFCQENKQTTHRCSYGCYFHACAECAMAPASADDDACETECAAAEEDSDDLIMPEDLPSNIGCAEADAAPVGIVRSASRSPSAVSEEDVSFCVNFLAPPAQTPSTAVPDDEEDLLDRTRDQSIFDHSIPPSPGCEVPQSVKSRMGRPPMPPCPPFSPANSEARSSAEGSAAKGMKTRLAELEAEVRELQSGLAAMQNSPQLGSKAGLGAEAYPSKSQLRSSSKNLEAEVHAQAEAMVQATREECQEVMASLAHELQQEVQAMADPKNVFAMMQHLEEAGAQQSPPIKTSADKSDKVLNHLRQEVNGSIEGLRKDFESKSQALKAELSTMVAAPVKELQGKLEARMGQELALAKKVDAQQAEVVKVRRELAADIEGLRGDLQKVQSGGMTSSAASLSGDNSKADFARSLPGSLNSRPPTLEPDLSRGRLRPRTPSSSAAKLRQASDFASARSSDADIASSECFQGMATALVAVARVVGLMKDGGNDKLGQGEWEWAKVGRRFEQAWASQTKEMWQFGMPLRPTLVDFLRSKVDPGLSRGVATKLPDRREGARLAERLASGLSVPNCVPSSFFNANASTDSSVRDLSQYASMQHLATADNADLKQKAQSAAATTADQNEKRAFAGLEALRQMRRQKNE